MTRIETTLALPDTMSSVIRTFLARWNDGLRSDGERDRLLPPLVALAAGTSTSKEDETVRAWMCTDWMARECAPAFLRLAGLTEHAELLEALAPIVSPSTAKKAQPTLGAARKAADASWDASWAASWAASGNYEEKYRAARKAADDVLEPAVQLLQQSAVLLVTRMCEVGR